MGQNIEVNLKILPSYISDEIYIIRAFNDKQEAQISEFTENIEKHIEIAEVERWFQFSADDGEVGIEQIEHIAGISEEEYDIRDVFTEIMPIYQRQAMLLTLWGAFECEMEKMYLFTSKTKKLPDKKKGDKSSKFKHMINLFKKNSIPVEPSEDFCKAINVLDNEVRFIRNAWAHNGGKFPKNKISENIPGIDEKYSQISISQEYIKIVVEMILVISKELNTSVRNSALEANKENQGNG